VEKPETFWNYVSVSRERGKIKLTCAKEAASWKNMKNNKLFQKKNLQSISA